jgi:hypothetical protein
MYITVSNCSNCHGYTLRQTRWNPLHRKAVIDPLQHTDTTTVATTFLSLQNCNNNNQQTDDDISKESFRESHNLNSVITPILVAFSVFLTCCTFQSTVVHAAPPFAVIAEELGYFPIMVPSSPGSSSTTKGTIQYVPKRVQRTSTQQAIDLAHYIRTEQKVILAGTYWCPHTTRQKELFGIEAWNELNMKEPTSTTKKQQQINAISSKGHGFSYIECAPQGYRGNPTICSNLKVDGYPTWIITTKESDNISKQKSTITTKRLSGEYSLADIAKAVGYNTFDATIEATSNPPSILGSSTCRLNKP